MADKNQIILRTDQLQAFYLLDMLGTQKTVKAVLNTENLPVSFQYGSFYYTADHCVESGAIPSSGQYGNPFFHSSSDS